MNARKLCVLSVVVLLSCSGGRGSDDTRDEGSPADDGVMVSDMSTPCTGCGDADAECSPVSDADCAAVAPPSRDEISMAIRSTDLAVWTLIGAENAAASVASGVPTDETGLLGRNREWGAMYSARFQMGAGLAVRSHLAGGDADLAGRAFLAVEVGTETIEADGMMPSSVPDEVAMGQQPSPADIASGAAFFLGDACMAMLALDGHELAEQVASEDRRAAVVERLTLAVSWLLTQEDVLVAADREAPNRLLHNAVAFQSCGQLDQNTAAFEAADRFVDAAQVNYDAAASTWIEGGGFDTSYQAVAVYMAADTILAGGGSPRLETQLRDSTTRLAETVAEDGRVDSTGNTRTCGGCEVFLPGGPPKQVNLTGFLRGLTYGGTLGDVESARAAALRYISWARTSPTTSCYVRDDAGDLVPLDRTVCDG